jgi:hypothetical protein
VRATSRARIARHNSAWTAPCMGSTGRSLSLEFPECEARESACFWCWSPRSVQPPFSWLTGRSTPLQRPLRRRSRLSSRRRTRRPTTRTLKLLRSSIPLAKSSASRCSPDDWEVGLPWDWCLQTRAARTVRPAVPASATLVGRPGQKGGTAGQLCKEHDPTPAPGARARPDFRRWRTICLRRQD